MLSEQECTRILNSGDIKYTKDEMIIVRGLLVSLAKIEYDVYREQKSTTAHCQSTERQDLGTEENRRAA